MVDSTAPNRRQIISALLVLVVCSLCSTAKAATLPEGLESKPLIDQLLARKAYLAEYFKTDAWRRQKKQQLEACSSPHCRQGVLIVAGDPHMFANAAVTLQVLRGHLRSSIPVEIVHYGPKELPSKGVLDFIASFNGTGTSSNSSIPGTVLGPVFITDAMAAAPAAHHRQLPMPIRSYPAKVYALTHVTRFQKVLLVDSDNLPLVDPHILFHVPSFLRSGSLAWPDLWHNRWVQPAIYTQVGGMKGAPWEGNLGHRLAESGQLLLDRVRHAEVLEYLWLLNSHHEWVYKHMYGDKDTYLVAFSMAGQREAFQMVPSLPRDALHDVPGHDYRFHHLAMVQSMPPAMLGAALRGQAHARGLTRPGGSSAGLAIARGLHQVPVVAPATASNSGGQPVASTKGAQPNPRDALIGIPVFLHRTTGMAKFFPSCLNADKLKTGYCKVQWVSVPLSNNQAGSLFKPVEFGYYDNQVDTMFYTRNCNRLRTADYNSNSSSNTAETAPVRRTGRRPVFEQFGVPPEILCDKLPVNLDIVPFPVMRVELFPYMHQVLHASYAAFARVRRVAGHPM